MRTAKRLFILVTGGETKKSVYVVIDAKDGGRLHAWLPKDRITFIKRYYTWGGGKSAVIEFPVSLASSFVTTKTKIYE